MGRYQGNIPLLHWEMCQGIDVIICVDIVRAMLFLNALSEMVLIVEENYVGRITFIDGLPMVLSKKVSIGEEDLVFDLCFDGKVLTKNTPFSKILFILSSSFIWMKKILDKVGLIDQSFASM
jgi:hypothetical protein